MMILVFELVISFKSYSIQQKMQKQSWAVFTYYIKSELFRHKKYLSQLILDFSKAFDSVNHRKLIYKVEKLGIRTIFVHWIKQFLIGRKQFVCIDGVESEPCNVISGVPQGSVLGPLLFLLYVNDLPQQITSECRLFADDALVYNTRNNSDDLKSDLKALENWSHTWQLTFNPSKCSVLSIGKKHSHQNYFLNNTKLKTVNSHPYLGVELSSDLKWDRHIDKILAKANKIKGLLSRVLKTADTKTRLVAYKTLVRSNLEYASQVWDPHLKRDIKRLEKFQNKCLKFIYRVKSRVSFSKLRADTNIPSLQERRRTQRLKLYVKVMGSGVLKNPFTAPDSQHCTRQDSSHYIPAIKSTAYFNSFWPRTTRDIRDKASA